MVVWDLDAGNFDNFNQRQAIGREVKTPFILLGLLLVLSIAPAQTGQIRAPR
jgi:hypothetical protein